MQRCTTIKAKYWQGAQKHFRYLSYSFFTGKHCLFLNKSPLLLFLSFIANQWQKICLICPTITHSIDIGTKWHYPERRAHRLDDFSQSEMMILYYQFHNINEKDGLHFDESCKVAIVLVLYCKAQMYYLCNFPFERKNWKRLFHFTAFSQSYCLMNVNIPAFYEFECRRQLTDHT